MYFQNSVFCLFMRVYFIECIFEINGIEQIWIRSYTFSIFCLLKEYTKEILKLVAYIFSIFLSELSCLICLQLIFESIWISHMCSALF